MDKSAIRRFADSLGRRERRKADKIIRISKRLKPGATFTTGTGKINRIIAKDQTHIHIQASRTTFTIPLENARKMLAYFEQVRIIERKELEAFHHYNSALMGLLHSIFRERTRVFKTGQLLRLIKTGVRFFLAGGDRSPRDLRLAAEAGAKYVLFSYYHIRKGKAWKEYLKQNKLRCILDSGTFSEWMAIKKGKFVEPILIDNYISFIKEHQDVIEHYFVLDTIGNPEATKANQAHMEAHGLTPIPVFHKGSPFKELDRMVETYPVVGLGACVNQPGVMEFLDEVFERHPTAAFHGLGISKAELVHKYPFFSCDSSAWIYCRVKGKILTSAGQVKRPDIPLAERIMQSIKFLNTLERPAKPCIV